MDYDCARHYLLARPESLEDYPFGPQAAVFRIKGKMFATLSISKNELGADRSGLACMNLKCDPLEAQALRDIFEAVIPGYHMNKKHWNTVILDGSIPVSEIERMIDRSYCLVVKKLKKADRLSLEIEHTDNDLYC